MTIKNGHFPKLPLLNCPFITWFTYNMVRSYETQTYHYKGTALYQQPYPKYLDTVNIR